jgi:hypothetical protein
MKSIKLVFFVSVFVFFSTTVFASLTKYFNRGMWLLDTETRELIYKNIVEIDSRHNADTYIYIFSLERETNFNEIISNSVDKLLSVARKRKSISIFVFYSDRVDYHFAYEPDNLYSQAAEEKLREIALSYNETGDINAIILRYSEYALNHLNELEYLTPFGHLMVRIGNPIREILPSVGNWILMILMIVAFIFAVILLGKSLFKRPVFLIILAVTIVLHILKIFPPILAAMIYVITLLAIFGSNRNPQE